MTPILPNGTVTDTHEPWGVISFIHSDGVKHEFYTAVNRMTGSRLTAFDNDPPGVDDSMSWIRSVFRSIREKAEVVNYAGTEHFSGCQTKQQNSNNNK